MSSLRRFFRYPMCVVGHHVQPPTRCPHGPVVADCICCGKTCYYFGLSIYGICSPPVLMPVTIRPLAQLPG